MSRSNAVVDAVVTRLNTVTDIGRVHNYERYLVQWPDFLAQFAASILGERQTRGWQVFPAHLNPITPTFEDTPFGTERVTYAVSIVGMLGLADAAETGRTFADLIDDVRDALRGEITMGVAGADGAIVGMVGPAAVTINEVRQFGSVLAHWTEMTVPVVAIEDAE